MRMGELGCPAGQTTHSLRQGFKLNTYKKAKIARETRVIFTILINILQNVNVIKY